MLKIVGNTISINRGDAGQSFDLRIPINDTEYYTFQTTDTIKFGVYEANGFNKNAVLLKTITPSEETTTLTIALTQEETTIGELINAPVKYWYEIQLNDNTIIGYDENKAKEFILYPEGSDIQ